MNKLESSVGQARAAVAMQVVWRAPCPWLNNDRPGTHPFLLETVDADGGTGTQTRHTRTQEGTKVRAHTPRDCRLLSLIVTNANGRTNKNMTLLSNICAKSKTWIHKYA